MSFTFLNELPSPAQIQERYPLSEKLQELKKQRDAEISNVIKGLDNRFSCHHRTLFCRQRRFCMRLCQPSHFHSGRCQRQADHHPTCIQINHVPPAKAIKVLLPSLTLKKHQIWWKV